MPCSGRASALLFVAAWGCGRGGASDSPLATSARGTASAAASVHAPPPPPLHAKLDVLALADDQEVFAPPPRDLPRGGSLLSETAPFGMERQEVPKDIVAKACVPPIHCNKQGDKTFVDLPLGATHSYLRVVAQPNETIDETLARAADYLTTAHPPDGTRLVLGKMFETDKATKVTEAVGVRTFLVRGESAINEKDIVDAMVKQDGATSLRITLSSDAAARFEAFSRENVKHRIAIVIDGLVQTTPVIEGPMGKGVLNIVVGDGGAPSDAELAEATRVAKALRPPHE